MAKVFGCTMREACRRSNVPERAAYKWLAHHRDEVEEVIAFITPILKHTKAEIQAVAAADFKQALEERLGKAVGAVDKGLESDDQYLDAATMVFGYTVGKPAQKYEVSGDITHNNNYAIDPATLAVLNKIASGSDSLYDRAKQLGPSKVIDVSPE